MLNSLNSTPQQCGGVPIAPMADSTVLSQEPIGVDPQVEQTEGERASKRLCLPARLPDDASLPQLMDACSSLLGYKRALSLTDLQSAIR